MPKPAGAVIRSIRQQRGIKVGELAVLVGLSRKTVHGIENGTSTSIEALNRIANTLEVPVDGLLDSAVAS